MAPKARGTREPPLAKAPAKTRTAARKPDTPTRAPAAPHFTPELFLFLQELALNNHREWFADNKERYEAVVKAPFAAFLEAFRPRLVAISASFVVPTAPFRIHRDVRFSPDKSPYKTHAAAQFRHQAATSDVHAPGFYLHLEPRSVFVAGGMWMPDAASLGQVRAHIVEHADAWKRALGARPFRERATLMDDQLTRAPRGYDPEHPMIEHLRRKSHVASVALDESDACGPAFLDRVEEACRVIAPLVRLTTEALGLPF